MTTINERVKKPLAVAINGVDAGGVMTASITAGYDNIIKTAPDGMQLPEIDREAQFCRGTIVTQDWIEALNLLIGAVTTLIFYERKDGVAAATGYIKHTITAPVIYNFSLNFTKGGYATASFAFECKAADETKTIADMWVLLDDQAAPTYISAARGGYRVETCTHSTAGTEIKVYHVTGFTFSIAMNLVKACNDADVGYTCVTAELDNMAAAGSLAFQDGLITGAILTAQRLIAAAADDLVIVVTQGKGAADKTITIANVIFNNIGGNSDVNAPFTGYSAGFDIANDSDTPLTLEGANKIITIA